MIQPLNIFAVPEGADSIRDWIVWTAAIVGGLVAIGVGCYKIAVWMRGVAAAGVKDLLQPEFDGVNAKIDAMRVANEAQHAVVEVAIDSLTSGLREHQETLIAHLEESAIATEQLRIVAQAVETHIGQLREEITSPGLPITPGPLTPDDVSPQGPPHTRRMMF